MGKKAKELFQSRGKQNGKRYLSEAIENPHE